MNLLIKLVVEPYAKVDEDSLKNQIAPYSPGIPFFIPSILERTIQKQDVEF